jgi:uncharacterized coiled-coil protein SlyX
MSDEQIARIEIEKKIIELEKRIAILETHVNSLIEQLTVYYPNASQHS